MREFDGSDMVYKGPWVRTAQERLFLELERDYGFPRATCRSLVNLLWDFLADTFGEKIHEGQICINAIAENEPPGKKIEDMKSVPVHLTIHEREDIEVATREGVGSLRQRKIIRLANEAKDQGGLLTQEDLACMLCSSTRTIKRDIKTLKDKGILVPTRGTLADIGPGITHKTRIVELWLQGYEYTDIERKTGHSGTSIQRYLSGFSRVVRFTERGYKPQVIRELTNISERVVKEYIDLYTNYKDRPEAKDRIEMIRQSNGEKTTGETMTRNLQAGRKRP